MSKLCEDKLNCEVCSLAHPMALHMKIKDEVKKEPSKEVRKQSVSCGFVGTSDQTGLATRLATQTPFLSLSLCK